MISWSLREQKFCRFRQKWLTRYKEPCPGREAFLFLHHALFFFFFFHFPFLTTHSSFSIRFLLLYLKVLRGLDQHAVIFVVMATPQLIGP